MNVNEGRKWLEAYALPIRECEHPERDRHEIRIAGFDGFGVRWTTITQCLRCRVIKSEDQPWPEMKS